MMVAIKSPNLPRAFGLPKRDQGVSITDEKSRVVVTLAHCCKAQCFHKESQGYMNILYGQPDMMNTLGGADNGLHGYLLPVLKTQNGQAGGIVGTAPEIPVKSPVTGNYGMFIDAGNTSLHQTVIRKFPIFIAVGSEPLVGVGAVFIGKANCNAITIMGPQL